MTKEIDLISMDDVHVYHIGYSPETVREIPSGFKLLDNTSNLRPDWYEFWPIKTFLESHILSESSYYGFMSPKFLMKTGLHYSNLIEHITNSHTDVDAFIISSQPEAGYFFKNVYHGSDLTDPGCSNTCKKIFNKIGFNCDLDSLITDSRNTVFSNFIIAKKRFWNQWLSVCNDIYKLAENPSIDNEIFNELNQETYYINSAQRKVFVIEGIATLILASNDYRVSCIPLNEHDRGKGIFYKPNDTGLICNSLKISFKETKDIRYLDVFEKMSTEFLTQISTEILDQKDTVMNQTPAHDLYNDSILAILKNIEPTSVIEVGCMRGSLAKEYKKYFSNVEWTGVDIDPENVNIAKDICSHAIHADIEKFPLNSLPNIHTVKAWVMGDVLEHLRDPWRLLKEIRKISPTGSSVVACIPNSQHWSFQVRVNAGMMNYENDGLFDRTHLRFFSRATMAQMFEDAGFQIKAMYSRNFPFPGYEKYIPLIREMAALTGVNPDQAEADALAYQYVIEATI